MKIKVIENEKNKAILQLVDGDASICNLVRKELWNDDKIKAAAYNVDHPLVGHPKLVVQTTGARKPIDAVQDAIKRIKKDLAKVKKDFSKSAK